MSSRSFLFTTTRCCLSLVGAAGLGCIAAVTTALVTAAAGLLVVSAFTFADAVGAGLVVGMLVFVVTAPLVWRATW